VLPPKNWRLEHVVRLLLAVMISWFVAATLGLLLMGAQKQKGAELPPLALLVITAVGFHGVGLVCLHLFLRREGQTWTRGFGLDVAPQRALGLALATTLVAAPLVYGLHSLVGLVLERFGIPPTPQTSVELLVNSDWATRAVIGLFAVGLAPAVEEALFRGVLFPVLRDAGWPRAAWLGGSLLFGLIHGNPAAFLPLAGFGLFLTWLYHRTGNLLAPVAAHMLFNTVPFILVALDVPLGP